MKILIVEDEQDLRETIRTSLLKEKFVVETAADYFSALDKINDYDYDCILLDIMLPGGSGLDLLRELKRLHRSDSVLIISAKDSLHIIGGREILCVAEHMKYHASLCFF